jgi:hypothetical protein
MPIQTFTVKYSHGHFIDVNTKQRIIPVQGVEYVITAEKEAFIKEDPKLSPIKPLSETAKKNWVLRKYGQDNYEKILSAGDRLFFRVGNSKMIHGDESRQYIFMCKLNEDLYLYCNPGMEKSVPKNWRFVDCVCELDGCIQGGLTLTEKITAESINKLFSQTVMFFFNMQRSGSTNVYDTFFLFSPDLEITFSGMLSKRYYSLGNLRSDFAKKFRKKPE